MRLDSGNHLDVNRIFSIHLIVDLICKQLTSREIYRCCLVSRDLYITFHPNIFTTIRIRTRSTFKKWARLETQTLFTQRCHTTRSITTVFADTYPLLCQLVSSNPSIFQNLAELHCLYLLNSGHNYVKNMRKLLPILSIIDNSQNLSVLELGFFSLRSRDVDIAQSLASAIRKKGRRLQRLYITSKRPIEFHNMHRILWSSAAVQYLRLEFYYYRDWDLNVVAMYDQQLQEMAMEALCGDKYIGMEPSRIHSRTLGSELNFEWRELHLRYENFGEDFELLLKALRHSPMLESLTIPSPLGSHLPQEAFSVITTVSFPRLQHLDLYYIDTFNFDAYNNLQPLFEACIDLKSIVLGRKFRNSKVIIDSLILHSGHSLDRVILIGSPGLRSEDIIHILSACPRLRIFDALKPLRYTRIKSEWPTSRYNIILRDPYIQVKDIQSPKLRGMEWACSNLETLRITYRNEGDTADIQESLCQQISRLTKLQDLRLSCYDSTISGGPHGSCIGANGPECVMDALKDWNVLKDLRTLELRGLKDLVDRKELVRVRKQWTKLEWIHFC